MVRTVDPRLMAALAVAALGLAGCGGDDGGDVRTVTVRAGDVPAIGDAILIETRITDAKRQVGEVLGESLIGESAFCPGGQTGGGGDEEGTASVIRTFRCPEGRLTIRFSPLQPARVQSAVWDVVRGTGRYQGLRGGGSMVGRFETDASDQGRETFIGTVGK